VPEGQSEVMASNGYRSTRYMDDISEIRYKHLTTQVKSIELWRRPDIE